MNPAGTTTGACSRHGGMPFLSSCVSCGQRLCARCIVRTPVGFKCADCTGSASEQPPGRSSRPEADQVAEGDRRRTAAYVGIAVAVVVALLASAAYFLTRSSGGAVHTAVAPSTPPGPTDIPVQFAGAAGHQLSGDLVLPVRPPGGGPVPGVVIVPDWGSVDRNGMVPVGTLPDPLYLDLATTLANQGVASLRYDPAGQGQSTIPQNSTLRLQDAAGDAAAALRLLEQRVGVDAAHLSVVGDGWGGLVALQAAASDIHVGRLVLVSTPGRPVLDSVADRLQATALTASDATTEFQQLHAAVATLIAGGHLPDPATLETPLRPILQQGQEAYLRDVFSSDPVKLAQAVHVPALIIRAGQDPGISPADTAALAGALGPQSQVLVADNSSATLSVTTRTFTGGPTTTPTPNGGMQNVHLPATVTITRDQATLDAIANWIRAAG